MSYGQQLLARRKRLGLTQAGAASLLGVGVSTYRAWETDDPQRTPLAVTQEGALARLVIAAYGAGLVSAGKACEELRLPRDLFSAACAAAGVYPPTDERDIEADLSWARDAASAAPKTPRPRKPRRNADP